MGWMTQESVLDSRKGQGIFLFSKTSGQGLGPIQRPIQWVSGLIWQMIGAGHLPPSSSAQVKMRGGIPPFSHVPVWCGV